jgi:hypothetical protein
LKLHKRCADKEELADLLLLATSNCGRDVPYDEITEAVSNSEPIATGNKGALQRRPRWPERNEEAIKAITQNATTTAELAADSPVKWDDGQPHTEEIIDALFPGNPLLCAGTRKEFALTRTREEWRSFMANQQFIVPNPMTSIYGTTKHGEQSMRTLANTAGRRFLVVEFDQGEFDQHAALLGHLGKFAPLVLVVHSGNKSLLGWFDCKGATPEKVEKFFRYAVRLGADPATWTRCQYVRMPDGQRDGGQRQRVVYFNPSILN